MGLEYEFHVENAADNSRAGSDHPHQVLIERMGEPYFRQRFTMIMVQNLRSSRARPGTGA
jgi:hypothetical protein